MVHLCVSISDDGLRLDSVQKRLPKSVHHRGHQSVEMTTLHQQQKPRTRQDRSSCSSTASCPVFSGPYSDHEEERPLRRQSSPLLKGSVSSLHSFNSSSPTGSLSSLQGSVPCLQGSSSGFQGSLSRFRSPSPKNKGLMSRTKKHSLGSLESSSVGPDEHRSSSALLSPNGSSSDDDGSWETNSWSSGATCLLRTPVKQDSIVVPLESGGKACSDGQMSSAEDEIIYQNLIFSHPASKAELKIERVFEKTCIGPRQDVGTQRTSSACLNKKLSSVSSKESDEKTEQRRKFSQFLNEVTCRVLKSNGGPPQPGTLRRCSPSPPPPPSTPSHQPLHSMPINPLPPPSTSSTNSWCSPTSSTLMTKRNQEMMGDTRSNHKWSQTLPSCKVLEPTDMLRKVKGESRSNPQQDWELRTNIQSQASTGRVYLETDIDRVRRLDELVANGTLGKERNGLENRKDVEIKIPWEKNGSLGMEKVSEKEGRKDNLKGPRGDRVREKGNEMDKKSETTCWESDRRQRGRETEKKTLLNSHHSFNPVLTAAAQSAAVPIFTWIDGFPRMSYRSTSLPRPVNFTESDGQMHHDNSSFHNPKDDLRKRLSYTTQKLEMVESEFDSTRLFLETELRRAQEELDKFTDKLCRIQSSYATLQRINQDLEDKMHQTTQHHEEEKRALSREISVLNNHLVEAKLTINKLREDNDLYKKDYNLATQLLQCSTSQCGVHMMPELPPDFQERKSSHMEKSSRGHGASRMLCHSNYSDPISTSMIATILGSQEAGSSCPVTRSPSPQLQDGNFLTGTGSTDHLNRRMAYKTSDLCCSDTALYCPERWQDTERRQSVDLHSTGLLQLHSQNSTESNREVEVFHSSSFSHHEPPTSFNVHDEFGTASQPASSTFSCFSLASDDKGEHGTGCIHAPGNTLSSSHQGIFKDWREGGRGDFERKGTSSCDKDGGGFPKSCSIQHMVAPKSPPKSTVPSYTRTASCFNMPHRSSSPRLTSSQSMGSRPGLSQTRGGAPERQSGILVTQDDLSSRWRQLSVEDINTFSLSHRNIPEQVSPYGFSEHHFAMRPPGKVNRSIYSSFQDGDDIFCNQATDQCFGRSSPRHSPTALDHRQEPTSVVYRAGHDSQDSERSLFFSGNCKDKEVNRRSIAACNTKDYINLSPDGSGESVRKSSLGACAIQHYLAPRSSVHAHPCSTLSTGPSAPKKTSPRYQKYAGSGLTRKDSLTKAQLYGTLLN